MINVVMIGTGNLGSRHPANFAQIDGCQVKRGVPVNLPLDGRPHPEGVTDR